MPTLNFTCSRLTHKLCTFPIYNSVRYLIIYLRQNSIKLLSHLILHLNRTNNSSKLPPVMQIILSLSFQSATFYHKSNCLPPRKFLQSPTKIRSTIIRWCRFMITIILLVIPFNSFSIFNQITSLSVNKISLNISYSLFHRTWAKTWRIIMK